MEQERIENTVTWNPDMRYALGLYKVITRILGTWPPKCQDAFSKIRFVIIAFLQICMIINVIVGSYECSSVNDVSEVMTLLASAILALLKMILLRGFNPKMLEIVASAMKDWTLVETRKCRKIMMSHAKIGRYVFIFQITSAYLTTIPLVIAPLPFFIPEVNITGINENKSEFRELPLRTGCIFGETSDLFYIFIYILQVVQLLTTCAGNIGNDVYFFGIVMHLCGQFQLLAEDLEGFDVDVDDRLRRKGLSELIKRHIRLSELAQYLEDSFNFIILVQLSANVFQISFMGIQILLSLKIGDNLSILICVISIYVFGIQLFLYSYAGDRLSSQIGKLKVSAYFFHWYKLPPRISKDVLFMIMRNQKSFNVTAGKIYRVDIENFKNVMKTLFSYFSVLRIMFED